MFEDVCWPTVNFTNETANGDGAEFNKQIPDAERAMQEAQCAVCSILYRDPSEVNAPSSMTFRIYDFDGVAHASGTTIEFSSRHIVKFTGEQALLEYTGVMVHESVHLLQNFGGEGGMVEGMADFVRVRAGFYEDGRRRPGGNWSDPYTTGGFFFSWLSGPGILYDDGYEPKDLDIGWAINQKMGSWNKSLFEERFGKTVETLWDEYQDAIAKDFDPLAFIIDPTLTEDSYTHEDCFH
jgi:hypothetical protein